MHLDEPVPQGCKIVIKEQRFWLANALGDIVEQVLWPRDKSGRRLYFYMLDSSAGPTTDPYNPSYVRGTS